MAKRTPQRMCVSCRAMKAKRDLIRVVTSQDGEISLDPGGKKPGRGAYVCRTRACLEQALLRNRLAGSLKGSVPESVKAALLAEMERLESEPADPAAENAAAAYRMLGLARRAGRLAGGSDAAVKSLLANHARLLIIAKDAAPRTAIDAGQTAANCGVECRCWGDKAALGHWTGSNERAVVAITDEGFAERIRQLIDQEAPAGREEDI